MKKILTILLSLLMIVSLAACKSKKDEVDPLEKYIGKYLLVELTSGEENYDEFLASSWADKSFYEYIEITADSKLLMYSVQDGEKQELESYGFDAETHSALHTDGSKEVIEFGEDMSIILEPKEGDHMVFEKTDEIPD